MTTAWLFPLLLTLGACGGGPDDKIDDNLVKVVERGDLLDEVSESGKIAPAFEVDIKSKVSGEILAVHVEEGQPITKGDLLYELLDTDYARELSLSKVEYAKAKLELENAEVERKRREQALQSRGVSEAEYDVAKRQVELAKISLNAAWVQVQGSQDRLDYCKVHAPMDGVVIVRNVEPGEVVTAGITATVDGEPQLTIAQLDRLLLELDLNQVDVAKVQPGQTATILLDAYPGEEVSGTVTQIAAAGHLDATRGIDVFTVKVELDPSKSTVAIKPGMTAEVRIKIGDYADVIKLPAETVFEEDGKSYVWRVTTADGTKHKEKVQVTIGRRSDREVEVVSGIAEGDTFYAQADVKDLSAEVN
ncbi:MAG: efflux RND transporter periplasmic adaptor subunit [Myxococcota bacterium]